MENKKNNNWFLKILNVFFITFMILYIISNTGYMDAKNLNKTLTTEEEIKNFENDVNNHNPINDTYIKIEENNYTNKFSDAGEKISSLINKGGKKLINIFTDIFSFLFT